MKNAYNKPNLDIVSFSINENIAIVQDTPDLSVLFWTTEDEETDVNDEG